MLRDRTLVHEFILQGMEKWKWKGGRKGRRERKAEGNIEGERKE